jgi:hypothetical protein
MCILKRAVSFKLFVSFQKFVLFYPSNLNSFLTSMISQTLPYIIMFFDSNIQFHFTVFLVTSVADYLRKKYLLK